jgi:hypothetical protein
MLSDRIQVSSAKIDIIEVPSGITVVNWCKQTFCRIENVNQ